MAIFFGLPDLAGKGYHKLASEVGGMLL